MLTHNMKSLIAQRFPNVRENAGSFAERPLSLDRTEHDALDEIALHERIDQQNRPAADNNERILELIGQ